MGERLPDAVVRLQNERLGCSGKAALVGFFRRTDMYEDAVFDDKLFAVHLVDLPERAAVQQASKTGELVLLTKQELMDVQHPAKSLLDIFIYCQPGAAPLAEHTYPITAADLSLQ